jgi:hypothetical protein
MKGKATWKPVGFTAKKWRSAAPVRARTGKPDVAKTFRRRFKERTSEGSWDARNPNG